MQKQPELLVAAGTTVHYDQDVRAERIINHGSITLAAGVTLEANELINEGSITPESGDLKLQCGTVQGDGTFLSGSAIHVTSDGSDGLTVNGGIFDCPVVHFKAKNDANIHANEITGAITLSAKNVAVGVKTGDLNIIEQNVEADPLYYSHSGSISFGGDNDNLSNVDFVAVAARSINGGAVRISGTGRVLIRAGVTFDLSPSSLEGETSPIADTMLPGGAASHVNIVGFSGFNDSTVNVDSIETETGNIDIQAPADVTVDGPITTDSGTVYVRSLFQKITVTGNITTTNKPVILQANKDIATGSINVSGPGVGAIVAIMANQGGAGTTPFTVGVSSSNGVNGTIQAETVTGGGSSDVCGNTVHIKNGGLGGIVLDVGGSISVTATSSRAGAIVLEAPDATISIRSNLQVNGSGSFAAGQIVLNAKKVEFQNGPLVSASDAASASKLHYISMAAEEYTYDSSGVTLEVNGNGRSGAPAVIHVLPKGSITVTDNLDPVFYLLSASTNFNVQQPVTVSGSAAATFAVVQEGNFMATLVSGLPVKFEGGKLDVFVRGQDCTVDFWRPLATFTGSNSLEFNGGDVRVVCDSPTTAQNNRIGIRADHIGAPANKVEFFCQGETAKGGLIQFEANGGDIPLGAAAGSFKCIAAGAYLSGSGDGGTVKVIAANSSVILKADSFSPDALFVNGNGSSGMGGTIDIRANALLAQTTSHDQSRLFAAANGDGKGGTILLDIATTVALGTTVGTIDLNAFSYGAGEGGFVKIKAGQLLAVPTGAIFVTGSAKGGAIELESPVRIDVLGILDASGAGTGAGGTVTLKTPQVELPTGAAKIYANGPVNEGGTITMQTPSGTGNLLVTLHHGLVSAANGRVAFNAPSGNVTVTALAPDDDNDAPIKGIVRSEGNNISLMVQGLGNDLDLTVGRILAQQNVTITLVNLENLVWKEDQITCQRLTLSADAGSLGTSGDPLRINAGVLVANTDFPGSGSVYARQDGSNPLTLGDTFSLLQAGGGYYIESAGALTVLASITAQSGDLQLKVTDADKNIVMNPISLTALDGSAVKISIGGDPALSCNATVCLPTGGGTPFFNPTSDKTKIFFDNAGRIQLPVQTFLTLNEANGSIIAFDAGVGSGQILLNQGGTETNVTAS